MFGAGSISQHWIGARITLEFHHCRLHLKCSAMCLVLRVCVLYAVGAVCDGCSAYVAHSCAVPLLSSGFQSIRGAESTQFHSVISSAGTVGVRAVGQSHSGGSGTTVSDTTWVIVSPLSLQDVLLNGGEDDNSTSAIGALS